MTVLEVGDEDVVAQRYEERVAVDSIEPHPLNPNEGDVPFIQESIREHGFFGACLVQESTRKIIAGEHRWRAAVEEGRRTVPCFFKDCDDAEALRIMLVDNEAARRAKNNQDRLEFVLHTLQELDPDEPFAGTGFGLRDLEMIEENRRLLDANDSEFGDSYGIIIECESEVDQILVFDKLTADGYTNLRVIAV